MDMDTIFSIAARWIHIGSAIMLLGGTICLRFVVHPVLKDQPKELRDAIRGRFQKFVHGGITGLLVSGLYNYIKMVPQHRGDGLWHAMVDTKIVLALGVFFIASVLVGRSKGTQKFRDNAGMWMAIAATLGLLIVAMSGVAKVAAPPKAADAEAKITEPATP